MSAQIMISILSNAQSIIKLKSLIQLSNENKYEMRYLADEAKKLGLKPFEWYEILKYINNSELLFNQLTMLELIVDNLLP